MEARKLPAHHSYADYLAWDDDKRWELIDGVAYCLASPSRLHQKILGNLHGLLYNYLRGKSCEAYAAPFDVRLNPDKEDDTVVQPDLSIICDKSKLTTQGCDGAPDMVIELLSPSTEIKDGNIKLNKYLDAGVRECWILNPTDRTLFVYRQENEKTVLERFNDKAKVPVGIFDDCMIDLEEVFPPPEEYTTEA